LGGSRIFFVMAKLLLDLGEHPVERDQSEDERLHVGRRGGHASLHSFS